jgi:hypothetical protein
MNWPLVTFFCSAFMETFGKASDSKLPFKEPKQMSPNTDVSSGVSPWYASSVVPGVA